MTDLLAFTYRKKRDNVAKSLIYF